THGFFGGKGGFGGGGGSGLHCVASGGPAKGGTFGGNADTGFGGGGAALGGAIFNHGGGVRILNSTFTGNSVYRGNSGGGKADNGADAGGAIFSLNGHTTINDSTISLNHSSGAQGGVVVMQDSSSSDTIFVLQNTIISGNGPTECSIVGSSIGESFVGNLIEQNDNCGGVVTNADPLLSPLTLNFPGNTPTMAITRSSPAFNAADPSTSLPTDQRGEPRPSLGVFDIGAFELCVMGRILPCPITAGNEQTVVLTMQVSPAGGGTTAPAPGPSNEPLNSVVSLSATPNPGFSFLDWTGDMVTDAASPSTTIIMDNNHTVTANFTPCDCAEDVTASVTVTRGGYVLNPVTGRYAQTVTVKNNSPSTLTGPLSLVLDNLSAGATLADATGATDSLQPPAGSPYLSDNVTLASGQSASFALQFADPAHSPITYSTRVLAGPGAR
ncbi:MAG TPA: choice-of-anchor Q domain-containing protein, partial [Candidatus Angelobacter sp.]|nr:choice-of-anchor Q domain-containing protein [Candidatus Angelobacter sp.]